MEKAEGSSPFIRFSTKAPETGLSYLRGTLGAGARRSFAPGADP